MAFFQRKYWVVGDEFFGIYRLTYKMFAPWDRVIFGPIKSHEEAVEKLDLARKKDYDLE